MDFYNRIHAGLLFFTFTFRIGDDSRTATLRRRLTVPAERAQYPKK